MDDKKAIEVLVKGYQDAIHSQNREAFLRLWSEEENCSLISVTNEFIGIENIYRDFLIGIIRERYQHIDLVAHAIKIRLIGENTAIIIFEYHTECVKRETREEYGIHGLETQVAVKEKGEWKLVHVHYSKD